MLPARKTRDEALISRNSCEIAASSVRLLWCEAWWPTSRSDHRARRPKL